MISLAVFQNSNDFPRQKARKMNSILTKREWNHFLILLVTICVPTLLVLYLPPLPTFPLTY